MEGSGHGKMLRYYISIYQGLRETTKNLSVFPVSKLRFKPGDLTYMKQEWVQIYIRAPLPFTLQITAVFAKMLEHL
jgi:hypothetical protein